MVKPKGDKDLDRLYLINSMVITGLLTRCSIRSDFWKLQLSKSFTLLTTRISLNHLRLLVSDQVHKAKYAFNMFVGRLHGDEIIVLQDGRLDHPPVVTYFTRYNTKRHL